MEIYVIIVLAIALALDAFAVSIAAGAFYGKTTARQKFRLSFHFGLFQFLMPIIGWAAGISIVHSIEKYDHWLAFFILLVIGIKMIMDSFKSDKELINDDISKGWSLLILSLATSIDALAVGFSIGLVDNNIIFPAIVIGIVTATMSLIGIKIGESIAKSFGSKIAVVGGVFLILIGINIVAEHLHWL